jgi:hypothetical protein
MIPMRMTENLSTVVVAETQVGDCGAIPDEAANDVAADTARTNRLTDAVEYHDDAGPRNIWIPCDTFGLLSGVRMLS